MSRLLLALVSFLALPGCAERCGVTVIHDIEEADVTLFSLQTRLEGTTLWTAEDQLSGRFVRGQERVIRAQDASPWMQDLRATDGATRSWTRLDAIFCDVPDESVEITLTDADRDRPCSWTLVNDTDTPLLGSALRRSGTVAWTRELLEDASLEPGATLEFLMDDDRPTWELQARGGGGSALDRWTLTDLGPCDAGEPLTVTITGDPDVGERR